MREGCYAVYRGKEYRASISPEIKDKDIIMLITDDISELNNGFTKGFYGITKKVKRKELETAYDIKNYVIYKGFQFQVSDIKNCEVLIYSNCWTDCQTFNMDTTDKYTYHKWICINDVEKMLEKKEPLWEFVKTE